MDPVEFANLKNQCIDTISTPEQLRSVNGLLGSVYFSCLSANLRQYPDITEEENKRRCYDTFIDNREKHCRYKIEKESVPTPTPTPLAIEDNPELEKKRQLALSQDAAIQRTEETLIAKDAELQNQAKSRLLQASAAASSVLAGQAGGALQQIAQAAQILQLLTKLKKQPAPISDPKIVENQAIEKQKKQAERERTETTRANIRRSAEAYTYPITPMPTTTVGQLPRNTQPAVTESLTPTVTVTVTEPTIRYHVKVRLVQTRNGITQYAAKFFEIQSGQNVGVIEGDTSLDGDSRFTSVGTTVFPSLLRGYDATKVRNFIIEAIRTSGWGGKPPQPSFGQQDISFFSTITTIS